MGFFLVLAAGVVGSVGENLWRVRGSVPTHPEPPSTD